MRARSLFARGSFDSYILLGSYSPFRRLCFILCMVDGAWLNYDDIKKGQINLILYDIITDAPGFPGDCVHKLRAKHSLQNPQGGRVYTPCT